MGGVAMNLDNCSVKVVLTGHGEGDVFINGQRMLGVTGITFRASPGEDNQAVIEFMPRVFMVDGPGGIKPIFPRGLVCWEGDLT
jgi:hypothetical protein